MSMLRNILATIGFWVVVKQGYDFYCEYNELKKENEFLRAHQNDWLAVVHVWKESSIDSFFCPSQCWPAISMIETGIYSDDLLVADRSVTANHGDNVIANLHDESSHFCLIPTKCTWGTHLRGPQRSALVIARLKNWRPVWTCLHLKYDVFEWAPVVN